MIRSTLSSVLTLACALLVAPSLGCGGGGGGGSGSGSVSGALSIRALSVDPQSGAFDVPISTTRIRVAIDLDADPSTVNTSTVSVVETDPVTGGVRTIGGVVSYVSSTREVVWDLATGQGLNTQVAGDVLAFGRVYRITLTQGIRTSRGLALVGGFQASFETADTQFSIVTAGTDPAPGASGVLIDPYRVDIGGTLFFVTLKFKIDTPLQDASVTGTTSSTPNVNLRTGGATGTIVPGAAAYDAAAQTIYWIPAAGHNPSYPSEPLLKTATAYTFTITRNVRSSGGSQPASDLTVGFSTIACAIRPPALLPTGVFVVDLQFAEVFAAPNTATAISDSNGDGVASAVSDEFVEFVNISSDYIDLFDHVVKDSVVQNPSAFDFSTLGAGQRHQALVAPGRAVVIWNGVEAGRTIPSSKLLIGRSKAFAGSINGTASSLWNNSGIDTGVVRQKTPGVGSSGDCMKVDYTNTASAATTGSMVRVPELTGPFMRHADQAGAPTGSRWSPGLKTGGGFYP